MLSLTTLIKQLLYLLGILLVSWVLVHLVAVFGIFLAAAIPILHLIFYPRILCFWCQLTHSEAKHTLKHSLIDSLLLLLVTTFSLAVVWGEAKLITTLTKREPPSVNFVLPERHSYKLHEIFPMQITVTGIARPINVVQADLSFDPTLLEVVDIDLSDSFATILVQKDWSNELGYVRIAAGLPNPGFDQDEGKLGTVYFRGLRPGLAEVQFLASSLVLENNGKGTSALKDLAHSSYIILPEEISKQEETRQQDIIIKRQVLGDTVSSSQLDYTAYQEELPKPFAHILGTSSMGAPSSSPLPSSSLSTHLVSTLEYMDATILARWRALLNYIR